MDQMLSNYLLFWVCIIGLCLGSFFNVVILRSLSGESLVFPASKCPKCGNKLKPWHNIPVFSYLFLRGKCAFCKEKISLQYPIIELITMGLFALSFIKFGISYNTIFAIILCSTMLIMTATDIKEKLVDCNIAIGLAIVGFLFNGIVNGAWLESILGLIVGVIVMELVARLGYLFTQDRAFGEADTYIAGALGACFGIHGLLQIFIYTLLASMIFVIPLFIYEQFKKNNKVTCVLFVLFITSALIYKAAFQNWYTLAVLLILGISLTFIILKNLKKEPSPLYLPLVPAFALGTLYFLFF